MAPSRTVDGCAFRRFERYTETWRTFRRNRGNCCEQAWVLKKSL